MNNRFRWKAFIFLLALILSAPLTAASQVDELFQKALVKESVERDLDGAIKLYQRLIDEAQTEPAAAGEARLRMGICFEKLGKSDYAEALYRQILAHLSGISSDVAQQARTNLRRIETEKRLVMASSGTARVVWTYRFIPSRFALLVGPSLLASSNGTPATGLIAALRFRTTASERPLAWFLEARGTAPLAHSKIGDQGQVFDSQGTDSASLSFRYQTSLGLIGELPHGDQKKIIPEMGVGLALTASKISYISAASAGEQTKKTFSPYVEAGLHVFPDRVVSILLQARYVSAPYPKSIDIQSPAHSQSFNFPSSQWSIGATLQMKIGRFVREPRR